VMQPR